ncbi:hypothetical protein [Geodermatophilus marinus]|uniref:hypothetical protein n=1 Tax=Geodermatophilus sp. LHW52908 TaxID=2303986 RepID=UPI0018F426CB|nr:hypothetical protein [Geodermatophilus sp. LHW52908]
MSTLEQVTGAIAGAVVVAALVAGALALAVTRRPLTALGVLLDLLVAAGLLRLAGDPDWRAVLGAAVVVTVRQVAGAGLRTAQRARSGGPRRGRRPPGRRRPRAWAPELHRLLRPAWRA